MCRCASSKEGALLLAVRCERRIPRPLGGGGPVVALLLLLVVMALAVSRKEDGHEWGEPVLPRLPCLSAGT